MQRVEMSVVVMRELLGLAAGVELDEATLGRLVAEKIAADKGRPVWRASQVDLPNYTGHADPKTPREFVQDLEHFALSQGIDKATVLARVVPVALRGDALRWWGFCGGFADWEAFGKGLQREFGAVNYPHLLQQELDARTQGPNEPLSSYVQAIAGYYDLIGGVVSEAEKVRRACDQMHPEFARLVRGKTFETLRSLAEAGPELQAQIARERSYRLPPPASWSVEPSLACRGLERRDVEGTFGVSAAAMPGNAAVMGMAGLDPFWYGRRPSWMSAVEATVIAPPRSVQYQPPQPPMDQTLENHEHQMSKEGVCWICRDMKKLQDLPRPSVRICYACGEGGHVKRYCPKTSSQPLAEEKTGKPPTKNESRLP